MIHSPCFCDSDTTTKFWHVQAAIISDLCLICLLWIVIATIHPDHDSHSIKTFISNLKLKGWVVLSDDVSFPTLGNIIAGRFRVLTAIHSSCAPAVKPLQLKQPLSIPHCPLGEFIWEPFNRKEHAILLVCDDSNFAKQDTGLHASTPPITLDEAAGTSVRYYLHNPNTDTSVTLGSEVISVDRLCPVFNACPSRNIFQHYFGIEFHDEDHSYVCAISSYEFVRCFGFTNHITYRLSHPTYKYAMDAAMPGRTSTWLLEQAHLHLLYIRDANSEIFLPNQFAAPAATIQAFVNGVIRVPLPSCERWIQVYSNDTEMSAIRDLILNPSKINSTTLNAVNFNYCAPLRQSHIAIEDGFLIYHEPIHGGALYTCL